MPQDRKNKNYVRQLGSTVAKFSGKSVVDNEDPPLGANGGSTTIGRRNRAIKPGLHSPPLSEEAWVVLGARVGVTLIYTEQLQYLHRSLFCPTKRPRIAIETLQYLFCARTYDMALHSMTSMVSLDFLSGSYRHTPGDIVARSEVFSLA